MYGCSAIALPCLMCQHGSGWEEYHKLVLNFGVNGLNQVPNPTFMKAVRGRIVRDARNWHTHLHQRAHHSLKD
eukprot:10886525-Prorocentrum_lima.AAC.1